MNFRIFWTDFAKEDYANILTFLQNEFGVDTALKFLDKTEKTVEQIETFPLSFPISDINPRVRKAVLNKNTSLIYRVNSDEIELLFFGDNRMKEN